MAPDLDSLDRSTSPRTNPINTSGDTALPTSPDPASTRLGPSPQATSPISTHASSPSHSLAATAAMNAGMQNEGARRASGEGNLGSPNAAARISTSANGSSGMRAGIERRRRRSSIRMNLNLNDPAIPAPGEMQPSSSSISGSRRGRSPSIGEVYQDMESEQEAQVNRLLNIIRQQQAQLNQVSAGTPAIDDSITTPMSERSASISAGFPQGAGAPPFRTHSPSSQRISRQSSRSHVASRHNSTSLAQSPMLRGLADTGAPETNTRDEAAFYQAEAQNLTRENQMLKLRIRELERQVADATVSSTGSPVLHAHTPLAHSSLTLPPPAEAEAAGVSKDE